MKKNYLYILIIGMLFLTGCGCNSRAITEENVTTKAPKTDIEKEVLDGDKGIQDHYTISDLKVSDGKLTGKIQNKTNNTKTVRIDIMLMNSETYEQYGMVNVEVKNVKGNSTTTFSEELDENKSKADKFDARIVEES